MNTGVKILAKGGDILGVNFNVGDISKPIHKLPFIERVVEDFVYPTYELLKEQILNNVTDICNSTYCYIQVLI